MIDTSEPKDLDKETKMRKIKVWRDIIALAIVGAFVVLTFYYAMQVWVRMVFVVLGALYIIYLSFRLKNAIDQYYALTEDLIIRGGHLVKVSPKVGVDLWEMPLDNVVKVYPKIKKMPNTLYVMFEKDGKMGAEHFYKYRIKDQENFEEILKKRDLLHDDYVSLDHLKNKIG